MFFKDYFDSLVRDVGAKLKEKETPHLSIIHNYPWRVLFYAKTKTFSAP